MPRRHGRVVRPPRGDGEREDAFRPRLRGPRTAAHEAILAANVQLDDRDARIEYPDLERPWLKRSGGYSGGGRGVVADLETSGKEDGPPTAVLGVAVK